VTAVGLPCHVVSGLNEQRACFVDMIEWKVLSGKPDSLSEGEVDIGGVA
jgi:hypothetical protein